MQNKLFCSCSEYRWTCHAEHAEKLCIWHKTLGNLEHFKCIFQLSSVQLKLICNLTTFSSLYYYRCTTSSTWSMENKAKSHHHSLVSVWAAVWTTVHCILGTNLVYMPFCALKQIWSGKLSAPMSSAECQRGHRTTCARLSNHLFSVCFFSFFRWL